MDDHNTLVDLRGLSEETKLSKRWLSREAASGRIPSLKAGGKRLFNVVAVQRTLAVRAARPFCEADPQLADAKGGSIESDQS